SSTLGCCMFRTCRKSADEDFLDSSMIDVRNCTKEFRSRKGPPKWLLLFCRCSRHFEWTCHFYGVAITQQVVYRCAFRLPKRIRIKFRLNGSSEASTARITNLRII